MNNSNTLINFPDINEAIEGAISVNEICQNYIDMLNSTGNIGHNVYANKLLEYLDIDQKIHLFEDEFHQFKKYLRKWCESNNVNIFIKSRKKDFIGLNEKIRLFYPNPDKIHDLIGFRLVLRTYEKDSPESIKLCYQLLNELIQFFVVEKKYSFLETTTLVDVGKPSIPGLVIPSGKSLILEGFENKVRDYIRFPKETGYQSLHCCVQTTSGLVFEVQIRTFAMDISNNHRSYKQHRYSNSHIDLDYSKISLPGIAFDEKNEIIFDNSGLLKGSDPFNNI